MIFLTGKETMDETIEIKVTSEMAGKRLDVVLSGSVAILREVISINCVRKNVQH